MQNPLTQQHILSYIPRPIYRYLSDSWHQTLTYLISLQDDGIDETTLDAMKLGLTLGIAIVTLLVFFPGTNEVNNQSSSNTDEIEKMRNANDCDQKPTWAGENLSSELLDSTRKKFNLTQEQMVQVMEKSKQDFYNGNAQIAEDGSYSISQSLNVMVYALLSVALIYYINRDYDHAVTKWFVYTFPREADVLGITKFLRKGQ